MAFTNNIGTCSLGSVGGFHQAWQLGASKIVLEMDSKLATVLVKSPSKDHSDNALVRAIKRLIQLDWIIDVAHVFDLINFVIFLFLFFL